MKTLTNKNKVRQRKGAQHQRFVDARHSHATDPRLAAAFARGRIVRKKLLRAEGGSISTEMAAERLGIKPATLLRRYRDGRVIGWKESKHSEVHFPVWQFSGRELLPGFSEVLAELAKGCELDDMARILFFLSRFGFLDDRRPLDLLRNGQTSDALLAVRAYTQP